MTLPSLETQRTLREPPLQPPSLQIGTLRLQVGWEEGHRSPKFQSSGFLSTPCHPSRTPDSLSRPRCPQARMHPQGHSHTLIHPPCLSLSLPPSLSRLSLSSLSLTHTHTHPHHHLTEFRAPFTSAVPPLLPLQLLALLLPPPTSSSCQETPGKQQLEFFIFEGPPCSSTCTSKEPGQPLPCLPQRKGGRASWAGGRGRSF